EEDHRREDVREEEPVAPHGLVGFPDHQDEDRDQQQEGNAVHRERAWVADCEAELLARPVAVFRQALGKLPRVPHRRACRPGKRPARRPEDDRGDDPACPSPYPTYSASQMPRPSATREPIPTTITAGRTSRSNSATSLGRSRCIAASANTPATIDPDTKRKA